MDTFGKVDIAVPRARLFTFIPLPPRPSRSGRTASAIERRHDQFKRRIKTQTVKPSAATAAMLFWALLAPGQISMRKADGWRTLAKTSIDQPIDLAASHNTLQMLEIASHRIPTQIATASSVR